MIYEMPKVAIMNMWIAAGVSILLPVGLLVFWLRKTRTKIKPFFIGAVTFIVFVFFLEASCHQIFLLRDSGLSRFINGRVWAYVLYTTLAAGIFEETGRFIAFKLFLKKDNQKETAITYGIGHGGIESILLVGLSMLSSIFLISTISKMGGIDNYVALAPAESQELIRTNLVNVYTSAPYLYLLSAVERIFTIFFHIALSVLVFMAARRPGKLYLYPAAIVLHALINTFAALYQKGVITSVLLMEASVIVIAVAASYWAYRIYQADTAE